MTDSLAAIVGKQVKTFRQSAGWTVAELADRCSELIPGLTTASVTNIERSRREVSVVELLILAHILRVQPVNLLLPLGRAEDVEIVPGTRTSLEVAFQWLTSATSVGLDGENPPDMSSWYAISYLRQAIQSRLEENDARFRREAGVAGYDSAGRVSLTEAELSQLAERELAARAEADRWAERARRTAQPGDGHG